MSNGVRDLRSNIALQQLLWRGLVPFDRPPPFPGPTLEDEDPAAAARRLRDARLISGALANAIATGDPAVIDAVAGRHARAPALALGPGHIYQVRDDTALGAPFGGFDAAAVGPISFPFILEYISITLVDDAAAGNVDELTLSIFAADTGDRTADNVLASRNLVRENTITSGGLPFLRFSTMGQEPFNLLLPFNTLIDNPPKFLLVVKRDPVGAPFSAVTLHIREVGVGSIQAYATPIPEPRIVAAPPTSRSRGVPLPLGFTFNVVSQGQILTSRTVPYSATAAATAGYNPVTGATNRNVLVHRDAGSWSNAFEAERTRAGF